MNKCTALIKPPESAKTGNSLSFTAVYITDHISVMNSDLPIKIFVDAHVFDQEYQGSRTFIKELYSSLSKKNNLHLYIAAHDTKNLKNNLPNSPNITFIPYNTRSGWSRLFFNVRKMLKQYDVDFAHFQYMIPPVKNRNCKYIVTIHDVIFEEYPKEFSRSYRLSKKMLYGLAAANADAITTVSKYSKKSIEKFLDVSPDKITVIPNAVSTIFFEAYDKEVSKKNIQNKYGFDKFILYVSRFEPRKNHAALLNAYLDLKLYLEGYSLVLPGHRSLPVKEFDDLLEKLPDDIRKSIFISSTINDDDLLELYRAASLFVYPSKAEGFGICPLEAAALKIPVICSNASAMQDFNFFGNNHIDCSDEKLLKEKIRSILSQPPGENSLQRIADIIRATYSWEASAEKFYQLLLKQKIVPSTSKQKTNDKLSIS